MDNVVTKQSVGLFTNCLLLFEQHERNERLGEAGRHGGNGLRGAADPRGGGEGALRQRRSSWWWQRVVQLLSPRGVAPAPPSPELSPQPLQGSDDSADSSHSSESSTHTVRSVQRQASSGDADATDVDARVPEGSAPVSFQVGDPEPAPR